MVASHSDILGLFIEQVSGVIYRASMTVQYEVFTYCLHYTRTRSNTAEEVGDDYLEV